MVGHEGMYEVILNDANALIINENIDLSMPYKTAFGQLPKLTTRVRFPSPAPSFFKGLTASHSSSLRFWANLGQGQARKYAATAHQRRVSSRIISQSVALVDDNALLVGDMRE